MFITGHDNKYPIKDPFDNSLIIKKATSPNNQTVIYTVNKDNQIHGLYRVYSNGILIKECEYKNGILDGVCKEWSEYTYYLKKLTTYKNGVLHGNCADYITIQQSEDGEIVTYLVASINCNYKNSVLHGLYRKYNPHTGEITARYYINGMLCTHPSLEKEKNIRIPLRT
jgi:antitoxin component YwqK of YwqJK toxin-antitoxin module